MARLRVRNENDTGWIDICQSSWFVRNASNTAWMRIYPDGKLSLRHDDCCWEVIDCENEDDCPESEGDEYGGTEPPGSGGETTGGTPTTPSYTNPPTNGGTTTIGGFTYPSWGGTGGFGSWSSFGGGTGFSWSGPGPSPGFGWTGGTTGNGSWSPANGGSGFGHEFNGTNEGGLGSGPGGGNGIVDNGNGEYCLIITEDIPEANASAGDCVDYTPGGPNDGTGSTSEHEGTPEDPGECPDTVYSTGSTVHDRYIRASAGNGGIVRIEYAVSASGAQFQVLHNGVVQAANPGFVNGNGKLEFTISTLTEEDNVVAVRVIGGSDAVWQYTVRCSDSEIDDETEGTTTHPAPCHGTYLPNHGGGAGVHDMIHDFGTDAGQVLIEYQMWNIPDTMDVFYRGRKIASTGGMVSGEGQLQFNFNPVSNDPLITIRVTSSSEDTSWVYLTNCPGEVEGSSIDPKDCEEDVENPTSPTFSGGAGTTDTFYDMGSLSGNVRVRYQMWYIEDTLEVYQGSTLVASTGGPVVGEGYLDFNYNPANGSTLKIRVIGSGYTTWAFLVECAYDRPPISVDSITALEGDLACFTISSDGGPVTRDVEVKYHLEDVSTTGVVATAGVLCKGNTGQNMIGVLDMSGSGGGRVIFDSGFPRYYNTSNVATTNYTQHNDGGKFAANVINWISGNNTGGNVLVIGDAVSGESYPLKGTFDQTFSNVSQATSRTAVLVDRNDTTFPYNFSLSQLNAYDCIIVLSTGTFAGNRFSSNALTAIGSYVTQGGGLFIITDHDVFTPMANEVAAKFNASFTGSVAHGNVSIASIISTYGMHDVWSNITTGTFTGTGSESIVNVGVVSNKDYTPPGDVGTVTIPAGSDSAQVCIQVESDSESEGEETLNLIIDEVVNGELGSTTTGVLTITDAITDLPCGEAVFSGSSNEVVRFTTGTVTDYHFMLFEYRTVASGIAVPGGAGNRMIISKDDGTTLEDTLTEELRYDDHGYGTLSVPMQSGMTNINCANEGLSYWKTAGYCPIRWSGSMFFTKFCRGIPSAVETTNFNLTPSAAKSISVNTGDVKPQSMWLAMTMIRTRSGQVSITGHCDDTAEIYFFADGSNNPVQPTGSLPISQTTRTVNLGANTTYFVVVECYNIPANVSGNPSALSLYMTDGGETICVTSQDWKAAFYEDITYAEGNVAQFVTGEAKIFNNVTECNNYMASTLAPSMQDIFNTWHRSENAAYYTSAASSSGDASAWYYDSVRDTFVQPNNVGQPNCILSPNQFANFTFEATLTSTNSDNDSIGLVMAFARVGSVNHVLAVIRTKAGTPPYNGFGVVYYQNSTPTVLLDIAVDGADGGWSGATSRVGIVRSGDSFSLNVSRWNDPNNWTYNAVIDLNSNANLSVFKGAKQLGFFTYSQADSAYLDVLMPNPDKYVFNIADNHTWEAVNGSWVDRGVSTPIGRTLDLYPAIITNPENNQQFYIYKHTGRRK